MRTRHGWPPGADPRRRWSLALSTSHSALAAALAGVLGWLLATARAVAALTALRTGSPVMSDESPTDTAPAPATQQHGVMSATAMPRLPVCTGGRGAHQTRPSPARLPRPPSLLSARPPVARCPRFSLAQISLFIRSKRHAWLFSASNNITLCSQNRRCMSADSTLLHAAPRAGLLRRAAAGRCFSIMLGCVCRGQKQECAALPAPSRARRSKSGAFRLSCLCSAPRTHQHRAGQPISSIRPLVICRRPHAPASDASGRLFQHRPIHTSWTQRATGLWTEHIKILAVESLSRGRLP